MGKTIKEGLEELFTAVALLDSVTKLICDSQTETLIYVKKVINTELKKRKTFIK